jgi:hypothetical protein
MIPEFHGRISGGVFRLNRPKVFDAYVLGQKDGNYHIVIHKTKGSPKTLEQLGYYYAVIVPTAFKAMVENGCEEIFVNICGRSKSIPLTEDTVDLLLKETCAKFDGKNVTNKAKMSKEECSRFIDKCIRWCARYLSCVIPPPDTE